VRGVTPSARRKEGYEGGKGQKEKKNLKKKKKTFICNFPPAKKFEKGK